MPVAPTQRIFRLVKQAACVIPNTAATWCCDMESVTQSATIVCGVHAEVDRSCRPPYMGVPYGMMPGMQASPCFAIPAF